MIKTYDVLNRRDPATDARMTIQVDDLAQQAGMCKVWCINFRSWTLTEAHLIGVDQNGEHYVAMPERDAFLIDPDSAAWVVPEDNIFYDEESAKKGLFTANLKYEKMI